MADATREANRLYWETDEPVGEIAARLDLSRRALYDALQPLPTGEKCSECGAAMAWPNRSARLSGLAICTSCGREAASVTGAPAADDEEPHPTPDAAPWTWSPQTGSPRSHGGLDRRAAWMGAAALGGALVAAAITLLLIPEE